MATPAQANATDLRDKIAELQKQLADVEAQERQDDLETIKSLQRKHNFNQRELGNLFKPRKRA